MLRVRYGLQKGIYDGHFMEKYIPHVYIFTGLKMIDVLCRLILFTSQLTEGTQTLKTRHLAQSELFSKSENRIKQINTFSTDNRHLIKKWTLSVSVCTSVDGGEASRFLPASFVDQKNTGSSGHENKKKEEVK